MRILIAVPSQHQISGNWVTGLRFQHGLERYGHRVRLCAVPVEAAPLSKEVTAFAPDLVLLLHAYRTGRPWLEVVREQPVPWLVLLTGTDVNHGIVDAVEGPVIEAVLRQAGAVLLQNSLLADRLRRERPELALRLHDLPPGIELGTQPYDLRGQHDLPGDRLLFFCPASLRPVKGVLELLQLFAALACERQDFLLLFAGPVLDEDYGERFLRALTAYPWARYLGIVPAEAMPAVLRQVDVVLNNSVSEGLPNALIEASVLGRPVLARAIVGNAAIIEHGVNGLLYENALDFGQAAAQLLDDAGLRKRLSRPQPERYHPQREAEVLHRLCVDVLGSG